MGEPPIELDVTAVADRADFEPVPARFWWLKRISAAVGVLIVALAVLRGVWGYLAQRRLDAQIEEYRAAGQFVTPEQFDAELDAVQDADNAAVLLEQAIQKIVACTDAGVCYEDFLYEKANLNDDRSAAAELLALNKEVLDLGRQSRSRPQVAWSVRLSNPAPGTLLSQQRQLAKLLGFAAAYHFESGDHAGAVTTLQDFLAFNAVVGAHPTLISSLVAWACEDMSLLLVTEYGACLTISDTGEAFATGAIPSRRSQVKELLGDLLVAHPMMEKTVRVFYAERTYSLRELEKMRYAIWLSAPIPARWSPINLWDDGIAFLMRPAFSLDTARSITYDTIAAEAVGEANWPAAAAHFPEPQDGSLLLRKLSHPLTATWFGTGFDTNRRAVEIYFRLMAQRRMAAIALAIRLYEVDHGHRPAQLAALVPNYLPNVPVDPFTPDGRPFGYRPLAERPLLYSVGVDGVDNGGQASGWKDERPDWQDADILFYLEPEPEPGADAVDRDASTPEAGDDDEHVEDGERE